VKNETAAIEVWKVATRFKVKLFRHHQHHDNNADRHAGLKISPIASQD
jgi:hypothetical protein